MSLISWFQHQLHELFDSTVTESSVAPFSFFFFFKLPWGHKHAPKAKIHESQNTGDCSQSTVIDSHKPDCTICKCVTALMHWKLGVSQTRNKQGWAVTHWALPHLETAEMLEDDGN